MYSLINKWIAKRIKIHVQNSASLKLFLKYIIIVNLFVYLHIRLLSLYSPMVFFPSLSTEMSFSFNRHSEYCRLQNLNKAVNYIWKNNYNKSVSIILFYFLIIKQKNSAMLEVFAIPQQKPHKILKTYTLSWCFIRLGKYFNT